MSTPSQAHLSLPLTISNTFWPSSPSYPSYRSSTSHLFALLQNGIDESSSISTFVKEFIAAQRDFLRALEKTASINEHNSGSGSSSSSSTSPGAGAKVKDLFKSSPTLTFNTLAGRPSNATATLKTLHALSVGPLILSHSQAIQALQRKVAEPFAEWSEEHAERVARSWKVLQDWIDAFEEGQDQLDRLRSTYESKCRQADEAEDDARFSGVDIDDWTADRSTSEDTHPSSDPPASAQMEGAGENKPSTDDRRGSAESNLTRVAAQQENDPDEDGLDPVKLERRQTLRKQFGFSSRVHSSGDHKTAAAPSSATETTTLERSSSTKKTLSSALNSALSAPAIQGIRDRLAAAAGTAGGIVEKVKRLRAEADKVEADYVRKARRLDTLRCRMEDVISDTFTTLQRLELDRLVAVRSVLKDYIEAVKVLKPTGAIDDIGPLLKAHDPSALLGRMIATASTGSYRPQVEIFYPFYHDEHHVSVVSHGTGWAGFGMNLNVRARSEALYRQEESLMDVITSPSKTIPSSNKTPVTLPVVFSYLLSSLEQSYANDTVWPTPRDQSTVADQSTLNTAKRKIWLYDVSLRSAHACREAIITHMISSSHPGAELGAGLQAVLERFDPPTKVMTLKVWLAELAGSNAGGDEGDMMSGGSSGGGLVPEENWYLVESLYKAAESVETKWRQEQLKKADPSVSEGAGEPTAQLRPRPQTLTIELDEAIRDEVRRGVLEDLTVVLGKLSLIHLTVLDSLILHLKTLISSTPTKHEPDSRYINKLALSLGSFILRPATTTPMALLSPWPTLLLIDLITSYNELLPPALKRKKEREAESLQNRTSTLERGLPTPMRKRTKPVDRRVRRSQLNSISGGGTVDGASGDGSERETARSARLAVASPPKIDGSSGTGLATLTRSPPKITTDPTSLHASGKGQYEEEEDTPTPIAQRLFGSLKGGLVASASALNNGLDAAASSVSSPSSATSPVAAAAAASSSQTDHHTTSPLITSSRTVPGGLTVDSSGAGGGGGGGSSNGGSNGGSDYGTPTEEVTDKRLVLEAVATETDPAAERRAAAAAAPFSSLAPALPIESIAEATEQGRIAILTPGPGPEAAAAASASVEPEAGAEDSASTTSSMKRERPLSNVARLSRQFATAGKGSGTTAAAAAAAAAAAVATTTTTTATSSPPPLPPVGTGPGTSSGTPLSNGNGAVSTGTGTGSTAPPPPTRSGAVRGPRMSTAGPRAMMGGGGGSGGGGGGA